MSINHDLVCLSHLRWDFVYQRPQHVLSRCAQERRVFYVEEPFFDATIPHLEISKREHGLHVIVPHLPIGLDQDAVAFQLRQLLDDLFRRSKIRHFVLWYYTPMAVPFTRHLKPLATVYDCMDELSAFKNAPPELSRYEAELFRAADLVFTGGHSLYEAKRRQHHNVYAFPSSVDTAHFARARRQQPDPIDQAKLAHPRLGYFGVIDERLDLELIRVVAERRPDWQLVMVGPVVKIDESSLPQGSNIHYLGAKAYTDLPMYLAGWDVALLPFARNESTRFISPTKTPEYLAAGKPVVSTPIHDVVRPYGEQEFVHIAETPGEFAAAIERAMDEDAAERLRRVDELLAGQSWHRTWSRMASLIDAVIQQEPAAAVRSTGRLVIRPAVSPGVPVSGPGLD